MVHSGEHGFEVGILGAGYVGLTSAACLARLGHRVSCVDVDEARVSRLNRGELTAYEPELGELVEAGLAAGSLVFGTDAREAVRTADFVFLCLPTPMGEDGSADLSIVEHALRNVAEVLPTGCVVVMKSTVPAGTTIKAKELIGRHDIEVVSNPEFLREGHAVRDFLHPHRIVLGAQSRRAAERVAGLYRGICAPVVFADPVSAEMVKYASNCFLAMKLSYVNSLAELCERLGADIDTVTDGMGYDPRIDGSFLAPGPGWGGSCLPKDTQALLRTASRAQVEFPLLQATIDTNARQGRRVVDKVRVAVTGSSKGSLQGLRIGLLGLTFKAGTDDLRDSPSLAVARLLAHAGAKLTGYDPCVPGERFAATRPVSLVDDPYLAAKDAAALVVLTEWPQFRTLDWNALAELVDRKIVVDGRNHLDPKLLREAGFVCHSLGKSGTDRAA